VTAVTELRRGSPADIEFADVALKDVVSMLSTTRAHVSAAGATAQPIRATDESDRRQANCSRHSVTPRLRHHRMEAINTASG